MRGLAGSLLSHQFLRDVLPSALAGRLGEREAEAARRRARRALARQYLLGPASPVRAVFDLAVAPLLAALGFRAADVSPLASGLMTATLTAPGAGAERAAAVLIVAPWGSSLDGAWREAVVAGIGAGAAWCLCHNGRALRLLDARRTYARRHLELDLDVAVRDAGLFSILWGLLRAEAFAPDEAEAEDEAAGGSTIDRALLLSDRHQQSVRASLERGVEDSVQAIVRALAGHGLRGSRGSEVDQALTLVYRILFLLFAEARDLVPMWHPTYRDGYSIAALCERALAHERARGLWPALQACSRLAHAGCRAGELVVTPFNGRLFAAASAPLGESRRVNDATVRSVLLALGTAPGPGGRRLVSYGDLGVEQLGSIYEGVLDLGRRKATGSFYTPRPLTEYLVRRALHPLVEGRTSREILSLKVLDLAMGSGAFLVAACRYLAAACERAMIRDGESPGAGLTPADRVSLRRAVAHRCLYGVDLNPTAVQLGRLSLWLATLAADRPLTFLDHRLRVGDSLAGASLDDLARRPPCASGRGAPPPTPLFEDDEHLTRVIAETTRGRARIAEEPGDTVDAVRAKEHALAALNGHGAPLAGWRAVADLWCAVWFWPDPRHAPDGREFGALAAELRGAAPPLPPRLQGPRLAQAAAIARERRFFHWPLEFPEAFVGEDGRARAAAGFDAVLGNPPWEMLRSHGPRSLPKADASRSTNAEKRGGGDRLARFARASGIYRLQSRGHTNLYQLFLERALSLVAPDGRVGLVLPSGLALDHGSAPLRRHLLERWDVDSIVGFENRDAVFPIHRSLRFLLLTATRRRPAGRIACRFGERDARRLDTIPDAGAPPDAFPVELTPPMIARLSGEELAIPELRAAIDLRIAEKASASAAALRSADGWNARFGRELNAAEDRPAFRPAGRGLPVVEGKQVGPFAVDVGASRFSLPRAEAERRLDAAATFARARLAYRDVASSENRLSLIAAIVPAETVTTHTLFCLKTRLSAADQLVLCGLLNSYVVNYLARQRIGTHLSAAIVERLPVARPEPGADDHDALRRLSVRLTANPRDAEAAAALHARVARLYRLDEKELRRILDTFPLEPPAARDRVLAAWRALDT
jgi:hypothetical protein